MTEEPLRVAFQLTVGIAVAVIPFVKSHLEDGRGPLMMLILGVPEDMVPHWSIVPLAIVQLVGIVLMTVVGYALGWSLWRLGGLLMPNFSMLFGLLFEPIAVILNQEPWFYVVAIALGAALIYILEKFDGDEQVEEF